MQLNNKTVFITGGSRGIGAAIALKLAAAGANVAIAAKSVVEDSRLGGTIYSVAEAIEKAGGRALPIQCDIRDEAAIREAVEKTATTFNGIDMLINNASAIYLSPTEKLSAKQFDLMHDINIRGTFLVGKACLPYLKRAVSGHILTLSPPINLDPKWFGQHAAYTIAKYGMTMLALGWAEELADYNVASNTLWPRTTIDTAAVRNLLGGEVLANRSRTPDIIADAAFAILSKEDKEYNGQTLIDEDVLRNEGIRDFSKYSVVPGAELYIDLFLD
ncbi:MAG: NAD(P)-dependent oxidoreductase [Sphingobacteriales bacterium]|nr:MAG: NAD(P)-dependent oxidoreductase [Sphingobacteriales bacterium]